MDTGKNYIKMCEKALKVEGYAKYVNEEYDELKPLFIYDSLLKRVCIHIWCPKTLRKRLNQKNDGCIVSIENKNDGNIFIEEGVEGVVVPLLRQSQLQGMLDMDLGHMLLSFGIWVYEAQRQKNLTSMEQLWLAFVMSEKYSKLWYGEYWINLRD